MARESRDELLRELGRQVREEQEDVQAFDEAAAEVLGLNLTDLRCLGILDREGRMTAGELARQSGLTTGSVTAMVDRLEQAGYARRVRDTQDRRRVFVELTDLMAKMTERIWGPLGMEGMALAADYSDDELRVLIGYLKRARELLRKHRSRVLELARRGRGAG